MKLLYLRRRSFMNNAGYSFGPPQSGCVGSPATAYISSLVLPNAVRQPASFIMRLPRIHLKDKLQPTIGKFQRRRDSPAPETLNSRTLFTGRFVSRPCWSLQLVGLSGIDESVHVFRLRFIQHGAVNHVVAAVAGQIIQQLLGMILDLIDSSGLQQ